MALGQFLNNPGSLVSVNDTRYFDPDAVTPRVCFFKKKKKLGKRLTLVVGSGSANCKN